MRKIWPLEDNCSRLVRNSHNTFKIRTAHAWCEFCSVFANSTLDIFLCIFDVNSFLIPVISQSQALLCKDYKRGGNHLSKKLYILHLVKFSSRGKIQSSLCFPFLSSIFFFLEAKQPLRMFSRRMRG